MDHLIRRECARSDRNGQVFSLVLFRVPGANSRRRSLAAHRLARVMLKRARLTDEVGWLGEHHVAALLPDTSPEGARAFSEGVCDIVARRELRPLAMLYTYPHDAATLPTSRQTASLATLAYSGVNGRSSNGHAHAARPANGNGNGHAHLNGNGHGNGHGHANGNFNGHSNGNGHSHPYVNGSDYRPAGVNRVNGDSSSSVALLESPVERKVSGKPALKPESRPAVEQLAQPIIGIEELLALPTPAWKRALDIVSAVGLMILLSPILAIAAIAIKLTSPGPVIFTQLRSGLGGKPFRIYKFRTMIVGAEKQQEELRKRNEQDGPAFKLTHDPRVTRVGHFLRKSSIDELPQLWNILRGEMSLVGPRPLPIAEQEGCEQWQRHRLNVTPGITCIWQVKGRSQVTFAEWVRMDVEYIRRRTILHDLAIIFSTIPSVLLRKGAR